MSGIFPAVLDIEGSLAKAVSLDAIFVRDIYISKEQIDPKVNTVIIKCTPSELFYNKIVKMYKRLSNANISIPLLKSSKCASETFSLGNKSFTYCFFCLTLPKHVSLAEKYSINRIGAVTIKEIIQNNERFNYFYPKNKISILIRGRLLRYLKFLHGRGLGLADAHPENFTQFGKTYLIIDPTNLS